MKKELRLTYTHPAGLHRVGVLVEKAVLALAHEAVIGVDAVCILVTVV